MKNGEERKRNSRGEDLGHSAFGKCVDPSPDLGYTPWDEINEAAGQSWEGKVHGCIR